MFSLLATLLVDSLGVLFIAGLVISCFFIWMNKRNARADDALHHHNFDPKKELTANIECERLHEPSPRKALRAYEADKNGPSK